VRIVPFMQRRLLRRRAWSRDGVEVIGPVPAIRRKPSIDLGKRTRAQLVPAALRLRAHLHQAGLAQHAQVLGRPRLGQAEPLGELADQMRPLEQDVEDASPRRLGQDVEYRHHRTEHTRRGIYQQAGRLLAGRGGAGRRNPEKLSR
jgi:hypothetical protein